MKVYLVSVHSTGYYSDYYDDVLVVAETAIQAQGLAERDMADDFHLRSITGSAAFELSLGNARAVGRLVNPDEEYSRD